MNSPQPTADGQPLPARASSELRGPGTVAQTGAARDAALAPEDVALALLWHHRLLGERLFIFAWVRFLVVAAILGGSLFATYVVGVEGLDIARLGGCAAFLVAYNVAVFWLLRGCRQPEQAARSYRRLAAVSHGTITLDFLVLTYLIWLVGGAASPFLAFYLLHVILAAILLTRWAAYAHAVFGYLLLAGLVVGEWLAWWPMHRPVGAVPAQGQLDLRYVVTVLVVYGLLIVLAVVLMTGIAGLLRQGEQRLRSANQELERLSNLRRAFLHIALHDLKAPVGATAMLLENLSSGLGGPLTEQQAHWTERARTRLQELLGFIRDLGVLSELETGRVEALAAPVDLGAVVRSLVEEHQDLAKRRRQSLRAEIAADLPAVRGVERLLREAVANYLTNALKYTGDEGAIVARVSLAQASSLRSGAVVRVEVSDNGRGITHENQARLFNEFVRILPAGPAAGSPPVSGTGLGLSIVRRIAEAHGGRVGVVSEAGKGSTFFLEVPMLR